MSQAAVKKYLAKIGAKGGKSGTGKSKARTKTQARAAARVRWSKERIIKVPFFRLTNPPHPASAGGKGDINLGIFLVRYVQCTQKIPAELQADFGLEETTLAGVASHETGAIYRLDIGNYCEGRFTKKGIERYVVIEVAYENANNHFTLRLEKENSKAWRNKKGKK